MHADVRQTAFPTTDFSASNQRSVKILLALSAQLSARFHYNLSALAQAFSTRAVWTDRAYTATELRPRAHLNPA
jgi:hypothetical protein